MVLPELAIIGYPPEDLVLRPSVVDACHAAIDCLVRESQQRPSACRHHALAQDGRVYNAAVFIDKGAIAPRFKTDLPNYGVFDEKRVFAPGPLPDPVSFAASRSACPSAKTSGRLRSRRTSRAKARNFSSCRTARPSKPENSRRGSSSPARARERPAAPCVCQSDRRTGRAGVRRAIVCARPRRPSRTLDARLGGIGRIAGWKRPAIGWTCQAGRDVEPPENNWRTPTARSSSDCAIT